MWDLWWTKWHWDRFFPEYFGFPLSISFHRYSITRKIEKTLIIFLFIFIAGLHNKPQGCGASVACAAGPLTAKKNIEKHKDHENLLAMKYEHFWKHGVLFHKIRKQSASLNDRQNFTELRVICGKAGGSGEDYVPATCSHPCSSEPGPRKVETTVLKWMIMKDRNPEHRNPEHRNPEHRNP